MVRKKQKNFLERAWEIICWPFKKVWSWLCIFWNWVAGINLVALLNLALLLSIIILFTLLIIDLRKSANASDSEIIMQRDAPIVETKKDEPKPLDNRTVTPRKTTSLPIKRDAVTKKPMSAPIQVAQVRENQVAIKQVAIQDKTVYGNTVIDHHDMTNVLPNGAHIRGDLYIQDLRKYTLPCDIVIDGNLFLRDVNLLNFCGDFTVRGNIYVSPRSSFGPVPSTARIGGQVLL